MPIRIQRSRQKGWKMPDNTVYVGRPTKWGNPYYVGHHCTNRAEAVERYKVTKGISYLPEGWLPDVAKAELRGKNLCCWCPLGEPCHADVLLEISNR
jgi:hypothetical protein